MRIRMVLLAVLIASLGSMSFGFRGGSGDPILFEDSRMIIEFNSTDQDVGVQVFLDGEPWKKLKITKPNGQELLEIETNSSLKKLGLTELFFESNEPELAEMSLEDFLKLFPKGKYKFSGKTIEGDQIKGSAIFSHVIPDGPVIVSPAGGQVVDPEASLVIDWDAVPNPTDGEIVAYQLIVESGPLNVLDVKIPASVTSFAVPQEFLQPGAEYDFEVLAIEAGGNQTITQSSFSTSP